LKDDLRHLILVIGPWSAAAQDQADRIIVRYLTEDRMKRFAGDAAAFAGLATRFADHAPAAESIDLAELPPPERAALVALTSDLYSVPQVRFAVADAPPAGQCMADPLWHTKAPGS
jgi:hypothetical protein